MTSLTVFKLWLLPLAPLTLLTAVIVKWKSILSPLGWYLQRRSKPGIEQLRALAEDEEAQEKKGPRTADRRDEEEVLYTPNQPRDWDGIVGFFHPFCNAAGGGERVLWAAIKATQQRYPKAICIVYTGDVDVVEHNPERVHARPKPFTELGRLKKKAILDKAEANFNIHLHRPRIHFWFLQSRDWVLASRYPYFTLLGQSLGSLRVAYDAFSLFVPDIFVDTMGYSFVTAFASLMLPDMPTGAYVHYPTISTDMLGSLDVDTGKGLNSGTGRGWKGYAKKRYWHLFARLYGWTGGQTDVVMTNSSWTQAHIRSLWGPVRSRSGKTSAIEVVFPPVSVEQIEKAVEVNEASEVTREKIILYIAQFRPEKNHELILEAFTEFLKGPIRGPRKSASGAKVVLIGSIRNENTEDKNRVSWLRRRVIALGIEDHVQFICNAPWKQMLDYLGKSSIGVNGMWNEHFGIGVVEYQAAGLICVVNDSGGPKEDIVVDIDGGPTGFHANTAKEYAAAFAKVFSLSSREALQMRRRARKSAQRFSEEGFGRSWAGQLDKLVDMDEKGSMS